MSASLFFAALGGGVLSSLVPFVYAEPLLLGLALAAPAAAPGLVLLMAIGQMAGSALLFLGGARLPPEALRRRVGRWRLPGGPLVGLSALVGLPPFSLLSLAAPALGVRLRTFVAMGLVGRLLRFGALAALPALLAP